MITSRKQYDAAKSQLAMLKASISAKKKDGVPEAIYQAGVSQYKELAQEIENKIGEYEKLVNGELSDVRINTIDELMTAPIRYRIATKMSVDEFGRKVGISARQIMRYEKAQYKNINATTFLDIAKKLNVKIGGNFKENNPETA